MLDGSRAHPSCTGPTDYKVRGSKYYRLYTNTMPHYEASKICNEVGATLAMLKTADEFGYAKKYKGTYLAHH